MTSRWIASAGRFFGRQAATHPGFFRGRVVSVTGAGSGIGREVAIQLNRQGAHLALADIDAAELDQTRLLCAAGDPVEVFGFDVRDRDAMAAFAAETVTRFGCCDALVANAGVLHMGSVESTPLGDFDAVMAINFFGMANAVKAFLPHLRATGRSPRLAVVSSAIGLVGAAEHAAYSASKFAVRGFAESLRAELAPTIAVTAVYPGGVRTSIARSALCAPDMDRTAAIERFENRIARTDADVAARAILSGVESRRARVLIGADAWLADIAARAAGPHFDRIVRAVAKLA